MKVPLLLLVAVAAFAQSPRAILVDGPGPWRDANWAFTVDQFNGLLNDAGYSVTTVSPADLTSAAAAPNTLLAVPSLESIPFAASQAVYAQLAAGGTIMASGGEPFRDPLYLAPGGQWLDAAAYQATVGAPPPQGPLRIETVETLSPSYKQYTNSAGLRVPIARWRVGNSTGRYSVIGDLLAPAATFFLGSSFQGSGSLVIWLPWPQLYEPLRAQLVSALHAERYGLRLSTAGAGLVWFPGEDVTGGASFFNTASVPVQAAGQWSLASATMVTTQPAVPITLAAGQYGSLPLDLGNLPNGDYTLTFRLTVGDEEIDRIDSQVRVLDPTLTRRPDQKIKVVNGGFSAGGQHVFLQGVNYWPRSIAGVELVDFNNSWLEPEYYDPDIVEADLTQIAALHFNLVNIQYFDYQHEPQFLGRSLIDFLERCRNHGIWARIYMRTELYGGAYSNTADPDLATYIADAYLPGNDRVFAYELLWEPMAGTQKTGGLGNQGRTFLDPAWRSWLTDQYGSIANAEEIWGYPPPLDATGQLTNPTDDEIANDGAWRIMVAAYRRFLDDYFGRNIGLIARQIRQLDPDTLLSYRNWTTMTDVHNANTGYDIAAAAAHLDIFSPERYQPVLGWPDDRAYGLVTAYSRYRTGGKPVQWTEFGYDVSGSPAALDTQGSVCDTMMRQVVDDGSNAASVWWWAGGVLATDGSDFGIVDPAGNPRPCAQTLSQWNTTFAATPPDTAPTSPSMTLMVDRDADARGSYGLLLNWQDSYVQARNAGQFVALADAGTGTTTATMPLLQAGNVPYTGIGPLKFANAESGGVQIVCPNLNVAVENGASLAIPPGALCQFTPTLVNTGEAQWLPAAAAAGGVTLHSNLGDVPLTTSVPSLQRVTMGPLAVTMGQTATILTARLQLPGGAGFGEILNLTLTPDSTAAGVCGISTSAPPAIAAPAQGATGTVGFTTDPACNWTAASQDPWVNVTPLAGSGSSSVTYAVSANAGPARHATILIANRPFTVTEAASPNPALAPVPTVSATSLNFGAQNVGALGSGQTITLTNGGTSALNLTGVSIGGLNDGDFAQTNTCGASVAAGASCKIVVTFTPGAAGMRTAAVLVGGNIAGAAPAVSLSGMGVATGPVPAIQAIVDAWAYTAGIAPGLWVTIVGTNLAGPPQSWNLTGLQQLPTALGGVTVLFNGAPAALSYVSATQINALVPASVTAGPVQVVAQVNGLNSGPFVITATATQPAVYAPPSADGNTFFVTAALEGTAILVGNSATDSRVVRAAYPGDILDLYMIGLGATLDPSNFITDEQFTGAFLLNAPVTASVAGENATVTFAGLTAPGLYLVRISLPADLAAGQLPLQVTAGAAHTRSSLVLTVAEPPPSLTQNGSLAGLALRKGDVYRLQFWARAVAPQTLRLSVGGFEGAIPVSGDWRQYTVYFQAAEAGPADLRCDLEETISIDGVVLQGVAFF